MKIGFAGPITLSLLTEGFAGCPPLPPGLPFAQSAFLAMELLRRGHEVAIFALDPDLTSSVAHTGPGWEVYIAPFRKRARARAKDLFREERRALLEGMLTSRCDVVHASWSYEFAWAALASGAPTLTTFHDWAPAILRLHRDPYRAARLVMAVRTLASRSRFTAVSPYIARQVHRYTRASPAVIPNFVPESWFSAGDPTTERSKNFLLAVNNGWDPLKNVATLLQAMPRVRAQFPDTRLVLLGKGYEPGGPANEWARHQSLTQGVEFRGPVSSGEIAESMTRATVLVHPSREESFGIVLIEAMASGLPVIAGDQSGGVPWVLDQGHAGVLTKVRNPIALSDAIATLLGDPTRQAELGRAGRANVRERFSLDVVANAYLREYLTLSEGASHV